MQLKKVGIALIFCLALAGQLVAERTIVHVHVVPVRNLQGNADFEYIAPTLTEAIFGRIRKQQYLRAASTPQQADIVLNSVYLQIGDTIEFRAQLKDRSGSEISSLNERSRLNANLFSVVDQFVNKIDDAVSAHLAQKAGTPDEATESLMTIAFVPMQNMQNDANTAFLSDLLSGILHDSLARTFVFKSVQESRPQPQLFQSHPAAAEFKKLGKTLKADIIIAGKFNIILSEDLLPSTTITARVYDAKMDRISDLRAADDDAPGIFGTTDVLARLIRQFILERYTNQNVSAPPSDNQRLVLAPPPNEYYRLAVGIAYPVNLALLSQQNEISEGNTYPIKNDKGVVALHLSLRSNRWLPENFFWSTGSLFRISQNRSAVHEFGSAVGSVNATSISADLGLDLGYQYRISSLWISSIQLGSGASYQHFTNGPVVLVSGFSPLVATAATLQYERNKHLGFFLFADLRCYFFQQPDLLLALSLGMGTAYRL